MVVLYRQLAALEKLGNVCTIYEHIIVFESFIALNFSQLHPLAVLFICSTFFLCFFLDWKSDYPLMFFVDDSTQKFIEGSLMMVEAWREYREENYSQEHKIKFEW